MRGAPLGLALVALLMFACSAPAPAAEPEAPLPTAGPTAEPGLAWASFIRDDCEWSGPSTPPAVCFGSRGPGFKVRAVRREGERWFIWDPSTTGFAYVDRNALSLPAELTADDPHTGPPARSAVVCVDRSSGYRYTSSARSAFAQWILGSAHPGDVFYLRWIEDNSYRPEAEIVPGIRMPAEPTRMTLSVATPGPVNPFDVAQVANATATVRAVRGLEASASATREALIGASTEALNRQLGQFLQTNPEPAPSSVVASSDVGGCVKKGSELLAGFDGDRYLMVATSARSGAPQVAGLKLDRVRVRVVYLQCDDPAECDQVKQHWSEVAAAANAADIRFNDPSEALAKVDLP
jgi:hypothetical protein